MAKGRGNQTTKADKPVDLLKASLKRNLRRHLKALGFSRGPDGELIPPAVTKEAIRALHLIQRDDLLEQNREFISEAWPRLKQYFASGEDLDPAKIAPRMEIVEAQTTNSDLFRLASLLWSVPVSAGYGRRIRFLVWDSSNGKVMGLIALGDPVFNLRVRDKWVGWSAKQRKHRLVNVLDAYVLGALPPYNLLLCGKVVASLICTADVRNIFTKKYSAQKGGISNKRKKPRLCLITTSSALGRSSVYNRLALGGERVLESIGYTEGWGHFHISNSLFVQMRRFLRKKRDRYAKNYKYGDGPNWRLRALRKTLELLGMNPNLLRHGVKREVFVAKMALNAKNVLLGRSKRVVYRPLQSALDIGRQAVQRWAVPRAVARQEYRLWTREQTEALLGLESRDYVVPSGTRPAATKSASLDGKAIKAEPEFRTNARRHSRTS